MMMMVRSSSVQNKERLSEILVKKADRGRIWMNSDDAHAHAVASSIYIDDSSSTCTYYV